MKALNKILVIGLVALIAMVCTSAVSAEPVERTVIGNTWNYDIVDDGGDYFIYDGTEDAVSASANVDPKQIDIRPQGIGYSDDSGVEYRDTIKQTTGGITVDDWVVPSNEPNYEFNFYKNGICGDFTGNYADGNGGAIYYTNGLTGSLSDGNGNLLTIGQSGFVVPDSSLNPPRPEINIPYYPTEQTDIVI